MSSSGREVVLHVSKFPPSPSGIALYASEFEHVLQQLGVVRRLAAPADPVTTQSLRQALRGFSIGLRMDLTRFNRVHVELSGRALFEFFFCLGLISRRRRIPLDITCHDSPSIVGASLLFRELDRRGFTRLGIWMSNTLGRRLENRVLRSASTVWALTIAGAAILERERGVHVHHMPHVVGPHEPRIKRRQIFVPGPVGNPEPLIAVLDRIPNGWPVVVGHCASRVAERVQSAVGGRIDLTFTGFLDEAALLEQFAEAAIVLRIRGTADSGNAFAASGPLSWAISRGCICITDDARAGALELADLGLVYRPQDIALVLEAAMSSFTDEIAIDIARRTQNLMGINAVAARRMEAISQGGLR